MEVMKRNYPEGQTWSFVRSDGALKTYIVTKERTFSSLAQKAGKVLELRYYGTIRKEARQ